MPRKRKLIAIDLFAGAGGLSLGLRRARLDVLAAVESDPLASAAYRRNHTKTLLIEKDIQSVDPRQLRKNLNLRPKQLDVMAGCPPCQGFSRLRTLNGQRTIRSHANTLVSAMIPFVEELLPKTVMLENVPGLHGRARFKSFVSSLHSLGYVTRSLILNAADYGVPQRRRRLLLLAARNFCPEFAQPSPSSITVRMVIESLPPSGASGDRLHDLLPQHTRHVQGIIETIPKNGGSRRDLAANLRLECHDRCDGFSDVYGRMHWDDVAPTITSGCCNPSKGRFLHPEEDRVISLREASILQGFPKSYYFPLDRGRYATARLIGNAFPPPFVCAHARSLAAQIRAQES